MSSPIHLQIKELIVRELNLRDRSPADIDDHSALFGDGLGLDSLDALQLAIALEETFGVRIPEGPEAKSIFFSVSSIAEYIEKSQTGNP